MTTPANIRRRVLRPAPATPAADPRRQVALEKRLARLTKEREALRRWISRLKRAFHAVEDIQVRIGRLERSLDQPNQRSGLRR